MAGDRHWAKCLGAAAAFWACIACGAQDDGEAPPASVLRLGNVSEPFSLDPHKAASVWENNIVGDMFIGLLTEDPYGEPVPGVAESWSVSDDGLVWTFALREMSWSDGVAVTANDFVVGMRRAVDPDIQSQVASLLFLIEGAEAVNGGEAEPEALGVRAVDEQTLEITLVHPAPYLLSMLDHPVTYPAPAHVVAEAGDAWMQPENIVVNGAYKLAEWRTNEFVRSRKNESFYDAENVCFDEVYYYPISDHDVVEERLRAGELDASADFPANRMAALQEEAPDYVRVHSFLSINFLAFNMREAPFDDLRVREALAMAIDRGRIVEDILGAGQQVAHALVPPRVHGYAGGTELPWANAGLDSRRDQARRLLSDAGYGPDEPLRFEFRHRNTLDNPQVAVALQSDWSAIAPWVEVEIAAVETSTHYANLSAGDFQVADVAFSADYNDAQTFLHLLETRAGALNFPGYSNPTYDGLIAEANATMDIWQRYQLLAQAEQTMLYDGPIAPLWHGVSKALVNPKINGWQDNASDVHRTRYLCTMSEEAGVAAGE